MQFICFWQSSNLISPSFWFHFIVLNMLNISMIPEVKAILRGACSVRLPPSLFLSTSFVGWLAVCALSRYFLSMLHETVSFAPSHNYTFRHDFPLSPIIHTSISDVIILFYLPTGSMDWLAWLSVSAPSHACPRTFTPVPAHFHMCARTYGGWRLTSGCLLTHSLLCLEAGSLNKPAAH